MIQLPNVMLMIKNTRFFSQNRLAFHMRKHMPMIEPITELEPNYVRKFLPDEDRVIIIQSKRISNELIRAIKERNFKKRKFIFVVEYSDFESVINQLGWNEEDGI